MKLNVAGKEVDLIVNGKIQDKTVKKAKLSDRDMSPDEIVRASKEKLEKNKEK